VGALAGPVGAAAGAAFGGSLGAIAGASDEDDKPLYTVIRGKLDKNSSALLLLADEKIVDRMLKELGPQGAESFRRTVSDELAGNLEAAIEVAAHG
jgi:uncharacterized membrane protein